MTKDLISLPKRGAPICDENAQQTRKRGKVPQSEKLDGG